MSSRFANTKEGERHLSNPRSAIGANAFCDATTADLMSTVRMVGKIVGTLKRSVDEIIEVIESAIDDVIESFLKEREK